MTSRSTPGVSNGRKIDKLGLRSSDTAEVVLENVRIPAEHLIGETEQGFKQALRILDGGRITIAAWCCGIARGVQPLNMSHNHDPIAAFKEGNRMFGASNEAATLALREYTGRKMPI